MYAPASMYSAGAAAGASAAVVAAVVAASPPPKEGSSTCGIWTLGIEGIWTSGMLTPVESNAPLTPPAMKPAIDLAFQKKMMMSSGTV